MLFNYIKYMHTYNHCLPLYEINAKHYSKTLCWLLSQKYQGVSIYNDALAEEIQNTNVHHMYHILAS